MKTHLALLVRLKNLLSDAQKAKLLLSVSELRVCPSQRRSA
jgi:hypothetical protein